jgi:hypothetical protein
MKPKRLLYAAASTAIAVLASCADNGGQADNDLEWRTSIDLPVNFSQALDYNRQWLSLSELDPDGILLGNIPADSIPVDSILVDLGKNNISMTSDFIDILRKTTKQNISYQVSATNGTDTGKAGANLTFYGMLFGDDDSTANTGIEEFYYMTRFGASDSGYVNIFGRNGLHVPHGHTEPYASPEEQNKALTGLLMHSKTIYFRWLVMLSDINKGILTDTSAVPDSVYIKLRIRFSGVNSFDSLFTL